MTRLIFKNYVILLINLLFVLLLQGSVVKANWQEELQKNTAERMSEHGYPTEIHQVETEDNYVITLFRIPYSHNLQNQNEYRPAILLQHGLLSCSDAWILSGPNDALAYLLADAGYDVWLGNGRGTRYSRNNTRLSTKHPYFWRFSWHEIGYYDVATMIDYILEKTNEKAIHYVGHSQGTTVYFVLMSTRPEYNTKIKTAHMLAPVAFMSHMRTLLAKYTQRFIGHPNMLTHVLDTQEVLPSTMFFVEIYELFCKPFPALAFMCRNLFFLVAGEMANSESNINKTVVAHINETHPAGASTTQVLHYMQEYESGCFCQLDHGEKGNLKKYGQTTPPDYDLQAITSNVFLYYSDNDDLADVIDVEYLATVLPNVIEAFHVPDPTFSHTDFSTAMQVKEVINDRIIAACNKYEASPDSFSSK